MTVHTKTTTSTPSAERSAVWFGLLLIAVLLLGGSLMAAGGQLRASSRVPSGYGPVTGHEFRAYLERNEKRLRELGADFDAIVELADRTGTNPITPALRDRKALPPENDR